MFRWKIMPIFVSADSLRRHKRHISERCSSWKENGLIFFKLRDNSHCRHAIKRGPWLYCTELGSRPPSFRMMQILVRALISPGRPTRYIFSVVRAGNVEGGRHSSQSQPPSLFHGSNNGDPRRSPSGQCYFTSAELSTPLVIIYSTAQNSYSKNYHQQNNSPRRYIAPPHRSSLPKPCSSMDIRMNSRTAKASLTAAYTSTPTRPSRASMRRTIPSIR